MKSAVVFIGNSIVNGFPLSRGRSFPGLIRAAVKAGETGYSANIINKGVNGETTANILQRFDRDVLEHEPACVFIMTGTNDFIYREKDPAGCMENLEKMARMAESTGIVPVHLTPLPVHPGKAGRMWMSGLGIDYDRINDEIEALSALIRRSGRLFVDTGAAWREYAADGECARRSPGSTATDQPLGEDAGGIRTYREDAWIDGVHPAPEGYQFLARTILDWMEAHAAQFGLRA